MISAQGVVGRCRAAAEAAVVAAAMAGGRT